jgi:2-polyprenyl-3-methyl-5-hydroxy-6-metoxy-1,4-benzoquinol methylase
MTSVASTHFTQRPLSLVRKALKRGVYAFRTGYWHSGERCCADFPDENFINHFKVYKFAAQFCHGKRILDVGCGTGYGTAYLAETASSGVGIDLSQHAIRYARKRYRHPRLSFLRMNAESLGFADGSFDFVISTENFEHLQDQNGCLREISRVLKDDGMLLLATPNCELFVGMHNPYHIHELDYEELLLKVTAFFRECVISENLLDPSTMEGQLKKQERTRRGAFGVDLRTDQFIWGKPVNVESLSNTHSFFCFACHPRRSEQTNFVSDNVGSSEWHSS